VPIAHSGLRVFLGIGQNGAAQRFLQSPEGDLFPRLKKLLVGSPLRTSDLPHQRLTKKAALAVFASDNLSSCAYATEEMLVAIVIGGSAVLHLTVPAAIGIVVLLVLVVVSYSQTLYAYPGGGGAYQVAKENLGVTPGLIGAAALLIDYVLTVAVSIAAGVAAITSAFPELFPHRVALCLGFVLIIMLANLRGVRESATVVGIPVYLFIVSAYGLVIGGLVYAFRLPPGAIPAQNFPAVEQLPLLWLFLRAFASGCTALTGVEAISTGVQAFKPPVARNASITLFVMAAMLGTLFLGITALAQWFQIVPREQETVLSQINRLVFGQGPIYYVIQLATTTILILAANTSFAGFPRLASILARDRFVPRQLANLGDRLVFSNGMVVLGVLASALMVAFNANPHGLIPLYMIGVFVSFTLSQAGMVRHWIASRERGYGWRAALNAVGAACTAVVLLVVAAVKFTHGAWLVLVAIPLLVFMFRKVRQHYFEVTRELSLAGTEQARVLRHTVIIPVPAQPNRMVLAAVEYAKSISRDVIAVHVTDAHNRGEIVDDWKKFVPDVPLVVLESPYRSVARPLLRFVDEVEDLRCDDELTVLLPEFVPGRWWHNLMHNQTTLLLKGALLFRPGIIVTSVPFHLRGNRRKRSEP
jgi:amino acid transporter